MKINKKAKMEWEYLAAVAIILIIIVVVLIMTGTIKTIILDKTKEAIADMLGRTGRP